MELRQEVNRGRACILRRKIVNLCASTNIDPSVKRVPGTLPKPFDLSPESTHEVVARRQRRQTLVRASASKPWVYVDSAH